MFPESDCLTGDDCSVDLVDDGKWDEWENDAALLARASRLIRCGDFDEEPVEEEVHDGEGLTPYAMGLVRAIFDAHSGSGGGAVSDFGLCSVSGWVSRCGGEKVGIHHPSVRRTWSLLSGGDGLIGWGSFVSFYEEAARKRPGDVRSDFDKYAAKVEERKLVSSDIWDECDISDVLAGSATATNSFELVPTCEDGLTPLESEQYIFVDEGSCIGCALCAQAAPEVFKPSSSGRYRTFRQRPSSPAVAVAIASCPVDCMHSVGFDELRELELERESALASGLVRNAPIHVQRTEAGSANHETSVYHTVKHRCLMSAACPGSGCYDCPHYSEKGANPHYKEKERVRDGVRMREKITRIEKSIRLVADL